MIAPSSPTALHSHPHLHLEASECAGRVDSLIVYLDLPRRYHSSSTGGSLNNTQYARPNAYSYPTALCNQAAVVFRPVCR